MKLVSPSKILTLAFALSHSVAEATDEPFGNLGFEMAQLPALPPGQTGGFVPVTRALPGWNAFLGDRLQTEVLHNEFLLGSSGISVLGPNVAGRIEGNFMLMFFAGVDPDDDTTPLPVSIRQTGFVPVDALSLQFKAFGTQALGGPNPLVVTVAGQTIDMVPLSASSSPFYTLYGGDISPFAGQTVELSLMALPFTIDSVVSLDSIAFAVPEPSTWALIGLGGLWLAFSNRRKSRRA